MIDTITQKDLDLHAAWLRGDVSGVRLVSATGIIKIECSLIRADLRGADLRDANLRGADIDFSCWPIWCGSNHVKVDRKIAAQLAAHFCAVDCDDPDYQAARAAVLTFAQSSHRAGDLGLK